MCSHVSPQEVYLNNCFGFFLYFSREHESASTATTDGQLSEFQRQTVQINASHSADTKKYCLILKRFFFFLRLFSFFFCFSTQTETRRTHTDGHRAAFVGMQRQRAAFSCPQTMRLFRFFLVCFLAAASPLLPSSVTDAFDGRLMRSRRTPSSTTPPKQAQQSKTTRGIGLSWRSQTKRFRNMQLLNTMRSHVVDFHLCSGRAAF